MSLETLTSLQNPRVRQAIRLQTSRGRKQQGRILIHGLREIARAATAGLQLESVFVGPDLDPGQLPLIPTEGQAFTVFRVTEEIQAKLQYGQRDSAPVAVAMRPDTDLSHFGLETPTGVLVVLEAVEKPGNLGAVARSVDASGASGIILADPRTDAFHPNAIRASTGTLFGMPLATGTSQAVLSWLEARSYQILTACLEGAGDFYQQSLAGPVALVLGNEAEGLSTIWRQAPCVPVKLPMEGQADSLNVSVTASVMLYEALRQRKLAAENG